MKTQHPDAYNPEYPTQALKNKLVAWFGDSFQFWLPKSQCKSELVYFADLNIDEAVKAAFYAL